MLATPQMIADDLLTAQSVLLATVLLLAVAAAVRSAFRTPRHTPSDRSMRLFDTILAVVLIAALTLLIWLVIALFPTTPT